MYPTIIGDEEAPLALPICCAVRERVAFGKPLCEDSVVRHNVAKSRMEIAQVSDYALMSCSLRIQHSPPYENTFCAVFFCRDYIAVARLPIASLPRLSIATG